MGYWSEEARDRIIDVTIGVGKAVENDNPPGTEQDGKLVVPVPLDLGKFETKERTDSK